MHYRILKSMVFALVSTLYLTRVAASDPPLADRITVLKVSRLSLKESSIEAALQELSETIRRDRHGAFINIVLVVPSEAILGMRISEDFRDQTLDKIIEELCFQTGMYYALEHHAIILGSNASDLFRKSVRAGPTRTDEFMETGGMIMLPKLLLSNVDCATAVGMIQTNAAKMNATGKPISVRSRLKADAKNPMVHAWLQNVSAAEAIEYICLSAGLNYESEREGVYVIRRK